MNSHLSVSDSIENVLKSIKNAIVYFTTTVSCVYPPPLLETVNTTNTKLILLTFMGRRWKLTFDMNADVFMVTKWLYTQLPYSYNL